MVAEELADELHVGSLAAARASAREFEERSCELAVLHIGLDVDEVLLALDVGHAVFPRSLLVELSLKRTHLESLHALLAGTNVNAVAAAEAVEDVDSLNETHTLEGRTESRDRAFGSEGRCRYFCFVKHEGTDRSVRTYICALVALDTVLFEPFGNECGHAALLVGCSALLPCAVGDILEGGYGEQVAVLSIDRTYDFVDEGGIVVLSLGSVLKRCPCGIDVELVVFAAAVNGLVVLVYHVLTLLAVALDDELLHLLNSEVNGDDFGDAEESALENGVRAVAEADFLSYLGGVDVVYGDVVLSEVALHVCGKVLGKFLAVPDGVEEECAAVTQATGHVVHVQISLYVASHEVRRAHQIGGADGTVAEAEVRAGEATRLLRVICEVCLAVLVGVLADDLHGVLVGAYRTVGTETEELGFVGAGVAQRNLGEHGERGECHVVDDAECEVVLRGGQSEVLVYADDLGGSGVLRSQTIAAAYDYGGILTAIETFLHVEVEGLAVCAGFLGAVKHGYALGCLGDGSEEVLGRERTVEVYRYEADLLALGGEVVDSFFNSLRYRADSDDDAVCVGCAVVVEEVIFAAGDFRDFSHVAFDDVGHCVVVLVAGFAVLEEYVAVLGHTACYGSIGGEGAGAEVSQCLAVQKRFELILFEHLDFLYLVRCTEAVEEVHERHAGLERCEVCHGGKVHHFLHGAFGEHGEACLTDRHDVLMVTENREGVRCESTGRYMEYRRKKFAGDFVHVGDHQEQTLRCSIRGGEGTGLERTVHCTGSTAFRLHFLYKDCLAEDVLAACCRPLVDVFSHSRRRCDGVDGGHLREHIADVGGCLITVAGQEFFFFTHNVCNRGYLRKMNYMSCLNLYFRFRKITKKE